MNSATEKMNFLVENARKIAKTAEEKFDRDSERIQDMTYRELDLLSNATLDRVSRIASESRKACDNLYSAYQSQVQMLDAACRPLLTESPEESAIGNVAKVIKWLNDESEIENNFSSSFQGIDLGNIIKVKYFPSMDNQMIQKFWESTFLMTETGEREKHLEEEHEEKLKRLERSFRDEIDAYEAEINDYQRKCRERESQIKNTKSMIERKIADQQSKAGNILKEKENQRFQPVKSDLQKKMDAADADVRELEQRLSRLTIFKMREKKEVKLAIQQKQEERNRISAELSSEEKKHKNILKDISHQVRPDEGLRCRLQKENPEPPMPEKPPFPEFEYINEKYGNQYYNFTLSEMVYAIMEYEGSFTVDDVKKRSVIFTEIPPQKIAACLRRLREDGRVIKEIVNGKSYFTIVDA